MPQLVEGPSWLPSLSIWSPRSIEGLVITIERSKTDQEGQGQEIAVPRGTRACPVAGAASVAGRRPVSRKDSLFRRLRRGGHVTEDPISPRTIATVVKKYAALAGFDPDEFGGHSPQGPAFATSAAANGVPPCLG